VIDVSTGCGVMLRFQHGSWAVGFVRAASKLTCCRRQVWGLCSMCSDCYHSVIKLGHNLWAGKGIGRVLGSCLQQQCVVRVCSGPAQHPW
jgi:hypothetical protein